MRHKARSLFRRPPPDRRSYVVAGMLRDGIAIVAIGLIIREKLLRGRVSIQPRPAPGCLLKGCLNPAEGPPSASRRQ